MKANPHLMHKSRRWKRRAAWAAFLEVAFYRKAYLTDQLALKKARSANQAIDEAALHRFWEGIRIDPGWLRFYNSIQRENPGDFDPRYVPLDLQYCLVDDWFNDTQSALRLDDKNWYDLFFHDVRRPETLARIIDGKFFDAVYDSSSLEAVASACLAEGHVILKPAYNASGGSGILFWDEAEGPDSLEKKLRGHKNYVIQRLLRQHPDIAKIYPDSINSIRIVTCHWEGRTEVLSALLRMGVNGNRLDNAGQGGLFCGINADGSLKPFAYNKRGEAFAAHPQGCVFAGCTIPSYDRCRELVLRLSNRFLRISKLISWDLSVDEAGEPVLIEVNLCYGGADIHQIANGPLFGEKTQAVLDQAIRSSRRNRFFNRILAWYK